MCHIYVKYDLICQCHDTINVNFAGTSVRFLFISSNPNDLLNFVPYLSNYIDIKPYSVFGCCTFFVNNEISVRYAIVL